MKNHIQFKCRSPHTAPAPTHTFLCALLVMRPPFAMSLGLYVCLCMCLYTGTFVCVSFYMEY